MKCVPAGGDVWSFIHTGFIHQISRSSEESSPEDSVFTGPNFQSCEHIPISSFLHVYVIHKKKTWKCDEVPFHFLIAVVAFKTSVLSLFMHSSPNSIGLKLYFLTFNSESQYLISSSVFFFLYTLSHNTALHVRPNWIGYKS